MISDYATNRECWRLPHQVLTLVGTEQRSCGASERVVRWREGRWSKNFVGSKGVSALARSATIVAVILASTFSSTAQNGELQQKLAALKQTAAETSRGYTSINGLKELSSR